MNFLKGDDRENHASRSNFLRQKDSTTKWLLSTVKTVYRDSDLDEQDIQEAVKVAVEEAKAEADKQ
ncbi:MAG: hypothetical protein ABEJ03_06225 [Candidatus Nanohaloarchaea archaeon]